MGGAFGLAHAESTQLEQHFLLALILVPAPLANDFVTHIMFRLGNDDQSHLPGSVASIPLKMILRLDSCVKGVSHR